VSIAACPSAPGSRYRNVGSWASSTSCMEGVGSVGRRHQPCNCPLAARCSALLPATAVNTLGSGRDVYLIQLPGEEEAADRHKECAARYWRKRREVPPDSCARHSWRNDYNCYIGSTEWKRFRCEVIKQRGNRCERCGHVSAYPELHHKQYHSLGSEQPEDVELLCPKCHRGADEARASRPHTR
jgi:hypothetical protein